MSAPTAERLAQIRQSVVDGGDMGWDEELLDALDEVARRLREIHKHTHDPYVEVQLDALLGYIGAEPAS